MPEILHGFIANLKPVETKNQVLRTKDQANCYGVTTVREIVTTWHADHWIRETSAKEMCQEESGTGRGNGDEAVA